MVDEEGGDCYGKAGFVQTPHWIVLNTMEISKSLFVLLLLFCFEAGSLGVWAGLGHTM